MLEPETKQVHQEVIVHEEPRVRVQQAKPITVEIWKSFAMTLVGILLTGLTGWFAFGANRISREEMNMQVENNGPYARDRQVLMDGMHSANTRSEAASIQIQALAIDHAKMSVKMDSLIADLAALRVDLAKAQAIKYPDRQPDDKPKRE